MYSDGFVVAVIIGVVALLMPMLWMAWWLIADFGEKANGTYTSRYNEKTGTGLRPAA